MRTTSISLLTAAAAAAALAGCGGSSGDGSSAAAPATTTVAKAASTSTGTATASSAPAVPALRHLTFGMKEFAFVPSSLVAKAGKVTITAHNVGAVVHELVVIRTNADPGHLPKVHGRVSEAKSVGEIADVAPGKTKTVSLRLKPGKYALVCNLPGHYSGGMYGSLLVK